MKYFLMLLLLIHLTVLSFASTNNMSGHTINLKKDLVKIDFPKGVEIFYQGWTKYYHIPDKEDIKIPKRFFQNNEFYHQRYSAEESKKSDKHGPLVIPDAYSFYMVVYNNTVSMYSARDKIIRKNVDSFQIDRIDDIPEDKLFKGGLEDLGKHYPGNCFKVKITIPAKFTVEPSTQVYGKHWFFCVDDVKIKAKMMKTLIKLKLEKQRRNGLYLMYDAIKEKEPKSLDLDVNKKFKTGVGDKTDGVMVMIWDWSECTLKCGGGKQYQQWMCIPPKNGGKPCVGDLIKERPCNEQKCPESTVMLETVKETQPIVKDPIIRIGKFSTRFNRYSKCLIKETDIYRLDMDHEINKIQRFPSRLVMNNKTITIYEDDSYNKLVYSFDLLHTRFIADKEFCCFVLRDTIQSRKVCGFPQSCGTVESNKFVNDWSKDFKLFKVDCNVGRQSTLISKEEEAKFLEGLQKKIGQSSMQMESDKTKKARDQLEFSQMKSINSKVTSTEKTSLKALEKEMLLEDMLKNEEKQKEDLEIAQIKKQIDDEKQKANCLDSNIKEKEFDELFAQDQREAEEEIRNIKKEAAERVEIKRNKLKKEIESMRSLAKLRKAQLKAKLRSVRQTMAKKMMEASKTGDVDKCSKGKDTKSFREDYCDAHIPDDYVGNAECKKQENFCYTCCEKEFGNLHLDLRDTCFNLCDGILPDKDKKKLKLNTKKSDQWKWKSLE